MPLPGAAVGAGAGAGVGLMSWVIGALWQSSPLFQLSQLSPGATETTVAPTVAPTGAYPTSIGRPFESDSDVGSAGLLKEAMQAAQVSWSTASGRIAASLDVFGAPTTDDDEDHRRWSEADEVDDSGCVWWQPGDERRSDVVCEHSNALMRVSSSVLSAAMVRAKRCSSSRGILTDCVLAHEVGLGIPGFYVHDDSCEPGQMKAILSPVLVHSVPLGTDGRDHVRHVRVNARTGKARSTTRQYNATVDVQYLGGVDGEMMLHNARLNGSSAFCFQLLVDSVSSACATSLMGDV